MSSLRHKEMHQGKGLAFPGSKGMSVAETPIRYINEAGELDPAVIDVLTYLADKPEVILATGHGSREEIDALIHKAAQLGVKRILVNHPHYMIGATLEDMVEWSRLGAFIELNATVFVPSSKFCTNDIAQTKEIVNAVGLDKIVVDSDRDVGGDLPAVGAGPGTHLLSQPGLAAGNGIRRKHYVFECELERHPLGGRAARGAAQGFQRPGRHLCHERAPAPPRPQAPRPPL